MSRENSDVDRQIASAAATIAATLLRSVVVGMNNQRDMNILGPVLRREKDVEAVLRSLPRWFGIEEALLMYVADSAAKPTFAAEVGDELAGFITLARHFPESWEVHCIAVAARYRNAGIGSALLAHAERYVQERGARFLQVKTVAHTSPSPEYAETRKFYEAKGFTPLEIFPKLWHPHNPALQLVKVLT